MVLQGELDRVSKRKESSQNMEADADSKAKIKKYQNIILKFAGMRAEVRRQTVVNGCFSVAQGVWPFFMYRSGWQLCLSMNLVFPLISLLSYYMIYPAVSHTHDLAPFPQTL